MEEETARLPERFWMRLTRRATVPSVELKKSGRRKGTHLRLGKLVAAAGEPDCDLRQKSALSESAETRAGKGDGRLVG